MTAAATIAAAALSTCFGTVSNGRIEGAVALPPSGPNFVAYSTSPVVAGRQYVHAKVADTILAAYGALRSAHPDIKYMYGETGLKTGGLFKPHRTHQNGLSVDFFVPVRAAAGASVTLPTSAANRFGYDIEFDAQSRSGAYRIDYPALAEHLYALAQAGKANGAPIRQVIFDQAYLPQLFAAPRGAYLRQHVGFMKGTPWVRHDEHFHVDFAVPCAPR